MTPIALCFVSGEDWPEYCRISTDLPVGSDYDTWLNNLRKFRNNIVAQGGTPIQIDTKPADLLAWCQTRHVPVNPKSRALYAATRFIELNKN